MTLFLMKSLFLLFFVLLYSNLHRQIKHGIQALKLEKSAKRLSKLDNFLHIMLA